jgi:molecular chaperone DnaK
LAEWCAEKAGIEVVDVRLMEEAERVKRMLSEREDEVFRLPFLDGVGSVEVSVSREDFEVVARPFVVRTLECCRKALADAGVSKEELDAVVLVGGSTRIPEVRRAVGEFFGREADLSQHPDEAVALGATIQAGILSGAMQKMVLLDVTPLSLGIETFGGLMNVLISRNTTIPCKAGEMFTNAEAGQRSMRVRILQGERELAKDNWELGSFDVPFEAAARGQARVGIQFALDADGILQVLARDTATGKDTVVEIASAAVDVSDEAVENMVNESVEHAFSDMSARIFTEARLKAEELLPAVAEALAQAGESLSGEVRTGIEASAGRVREAIETGDGNRLKAAVEDLDALTEALAARLLEEAMQEHWEQRLAGPEE